MELARAGFFNGLRVHRLVPNFVIQAGDPRGDGEGGPGYTIRDELSSLPYLRGTVGMALDANIGCFVVDNFIELQLLNALAADKGKTVNVLLRITPGVEAHTLDYISTGQQDSKFGFDLSNGTAFKAVEAAIAPSSAA